MLRDVDCHIPALCKVIRNHTYQQVTWRSASFLLNKAEKSLFLAWWSIDVIHTYAIRKAINIKIFATEPIATLREGLALDWLEMDGGEGFAAFRDLPDGARGDLLAWAVAQTLEPKLVTDLRDPVRTAVEVEVLPDLRAVWTPDEGFLKRLTKPDLLAILREIVDLRSEAQAYQSAKKSSLVSYMVKLFAEPFATLTDTQRAAVTNWCPAAMTRDAPEDGAEDGAGDIPAEDAAPETELLAAE